MGKLWSTDDSGEPWLGDANENPYVMLANPKHRRKGPRKGVMPAGLARYWAGVRRPAKRRAARRNPVQSRAVTVYRAPASKVTVMRRNPPSRRGAAFLSRFPDIATIGGVTLGFAAPGIITAQVKRFLPASLTSSSAGMWAVKAAAAIFPPMLLRRFGQAKLGVNMLIGGVVSLAVDALRTYFPTYMSGMGSQPYLGYYSPGVIAESAVSRTQLSDRQIQQRGMGMYTPPTAYPAGNMPTRAIATTPDRLSPQARF